MNAYLKIPTLFLRDPATNYKTLLEGQYSLSEFEYLRDTQWEFTEKVDGMNIRVIWDDSTLSFKGRTDKAQMPPHLFVALREIFEPLTEILSQEFADGGVCFYGEGYGPKIQKNGEKYRDTPGFILFDMKIGDIWLTHSNMRGIARLLGLEVVPEVGVGSLRDLFNWVSKGDIVSVWKGVKSEGIVARPRVELKTRTGKRIITKLKYADFQR